MNTNPRASDEEFVYFGGVIASIVDLGTQRGLEIGPFDRPFFTKEQTDVKFLDYRTTAELRAFASVSPGHSPHFVDELDYVVPGSGDWSEIPDGSFDWVLSAHALEHSPNLIGFLNTMAEKLRPGGLIISLLPDKRATFDAYRPVTSLGQIIEDYLLNAKSSRLQSVFDATFHGCSLSIAQAGLVSKQADDLLAHNNKNFRDALQATKSAQHQYTDSHNYVFTSETFYDHMVQICLAKLIPCTCIMHLPTRRNHMSFLNVLKKS